MEGGAAYIALSQVWVHLGHGIHPVSIDKKKCMQYREKPLPEAIVLDKIQTKDLIIFLLSIHSHLSSFAFIDAFAFAFFKLTHPLMYFFKLMQPLNYFYSKVTVHWPGERRKPDTTFHMFKSE